MNEFLEQFAIESRELIGQATDGLLRLEHDPFDADRLDGVFRAFHTLKGGAGIVDFHAMGRAVHAAEEVLSEARTGKRPLSAELIGQCLACLDQLVQWLDSLEATGTLPALAESQADALILRFQAGAVHHQNEPLSVEDSRDDSWVQELLQLDPDARMSATTAIRYAPAADCFFQDEDPLARMGSLPRLLVLDLKPVMSWPSLSEFDPYTCNLVLTALTQCSARDARAHLYGCRGDGTVLEITPIAAVAADDLSTRMRALLEAQVALLQAGTSTGQAGRVASAGLTAANAMRSCGRTNEAQGLDRATARALACGSTESLQTALGELLVPASSRVALAALPPLQTESAGRTLRVDADRIDQLVRLTGELTVAKNALGHTVARAEQDGNALTNVLKDRYGAFVKLVEDLQRSVLAMRVLPLRGVMQRFPRVVRELSSSLGKPIKLDIEGDHTEADKAIVEMLFEPLLHIVRNAIDHGVEAPHVRVERGKPLIASIVIRAARDGDRVHIEVDDDGGGIDVERVRHVAKTRAIASAATLDLLDDAQVLDLIFAPGFSTAAKVTEISGRGVGLDAVRSVVERIGGRVSVHNRVPNGTTVKLALPFSVMMTHCMSVEAGGQMFGIPIDAVVETVRVPATRLARIGAARVLVHRERTIPVVTLARELGLADVPEAKPPAEATVVIAAVAGQWLGLQVDRLGERAEVILKPLEGLLAGTPGIAGTTLTGEGRVLLVLSLGELLQ